MGNDGSKQRGNVHDFSAVDIDGNNVDLKDYAGKVLIITNVASK